MERKLNSYQKLKLENEKLKQDIFNLVKIDDGASSKDLSAETGDGFNNNPPYSYEIKIEDRGAIRVVYLNLDSPMTDREKKNILFILMGFEKYSFKKLER